MTITFLDLNVRHIPKIFVFSLYYDRWSNKLSTVCIIQLARLLERHWTECGVVCFCQLKKKFSF